MSLTCQKSRFSLDPHVNYLNNAYRGPILKKSEEAALDDLRNMRNPYLVKPSDFFERTERVKALFGDLVKGSKNQIAIIPSTSYGFAVALNNLGNVKAKKAITVSDEFPSGYFSLKRWTLENEGKLQVIEAGSVADSFGKSWNQRLLEAIDPDTGVVLISSVHWMNGVAFDLKSIGQRCREVGAAFIVDGTQSVGVMPIDVEEFQIDALICASYKWLLGPYSLALAYFGERFNSGKPLEESWMNRTNSQNFSGLTDYQENYLPGASRYDVGETSHFVTMPILEKSLEQILEWKPERMQEYAKGLKRGLVAFQESKGLTLDLSEYTSNHLFALQLPKNSNLHQIRTQLEEAKVYVSVRGESLRISINVFNEKQDLDRLTASLN